MKKGILFTILNTIFLIIFNVFFFSLVGVTSFAAIWVAYGFIHASYVLLLLTPILTKKNPEASLFNLSIATISFGYFLIEFVLDVVFIFTGFVNVLPVVLANIAITGVYLAILISIILTADSTSKHTQRREQEAQYIITATSALQSTLCVVQDNDIKRELENVCDLIHSSPRKSTEPAKILEAQILDLVQDIELNLAYKEKNDALKMIDEVTRLATKRNILLSKQK